MVGFFSENEKQTKKKNLKESECVCVQDLCFREGCDDEKAAGGRCPGPTKDLPGLRAEPQSSN